MRLSPPGSGRHSPSPGQKIAQDGDNVRLDKPAELLTVIDGKVILLLLSRPCWAAKQRARAIAGHGGPVRAVAVSADGKTRALRQLRLLRDPLVARAQRRRAGAALSRRRGECRRAAQGRPRRDRRRGRPHRDLEPRRASSPTTCWKATRRRSCARGFARRHDARLRLVGSHRAALAARGRRAARARRPHAERQRRRVHAGRQVARQRRL